MVLDNNPIQKGIKATIFGIAANALLAIVKGAAGIWGNSYALIADAIESTSDVLSSLVVLVGIKLAQKPADECHPYGHGKFEPMAAVVVALAIFAAGIIIALKSVEEIVSPQSAPAPFTLIVLLLVILVKETLFRKVNTVGTEIQSTVVKTDAWHHRSDAITSLAAFIGISIAIVGGVGYESADDIAALAASGIIMFNAFRLLRPALSELLDAAPDSSISDKVRKIASEVDGVLGTHKCFVRKVGFDYFVDLDILCDPEMSIRDGHELSHNVGDAIRKEIPAVAHVLAHIEPVDDYGKRSTNSIGE